MLVSPAIPPQLHHGDNSPRLSASFGNRLPPQGRPPLTPLPQKPPPSWLTSPLLHHRAELRVSTPLLQPESSGESSLSTRRREGYPSANLDARSSIGESKGGTFESSAGILPHSGSGERSPITEGRSILTMLLERERSGSTASDTTIPARGVAEAASSRTQQSESFPTGVVDENQNKGENDLKAGSRFASILSATPPSDETETPRAVDDVQITGDNAQSQIQNNRLVFPASSPTDAASPLEPVNSLYDDHHGKKVSRSRRRIPDEEEGRTFAGADMTTPLLLEQQTSSSYGGTECPTRTVSSSSTSVHTLQATSNTLEHHAGLTASRHSTNTSPLKQIAGLLHTARHYASPKAFQAGVITTLQTLPAVMLGLLLNILDGVSYGFIIFPAGAVFAGFGSMGVSMFFVTCVLLVFGPLEASAEAISSG